MEEKPISIAVGIEPNWEDLGEETWTRVEGGTLDAPIYVRIAQTMDGRGVITGIMIGGSWPRGEVTANSLRQIKIGTILGAVFDGWSIEDAPDYEDLAEQAEWGIVHELTVRRSPRLPTASRAASRSAAPDELVEFARVYTEQRVRNAHRAMTATAKLLNVSRATANRRAERCRAVGLLPPPGAAPTAKPMPARQEPF
ncbi:hypothetical protein [Agromyces subbeticus]|uniref:hypothetical protein n=1 Tax=Agromyces subbeticus TaxID=293890 RepID=UPI0003B6D910|nr:hypothetical protein [Agromyces subbeticus]